MKLYSKQLNSLEELKLEKQRLRSELKKVEKEGFFSLNDILPATDASKPGKGGEDNNILSQVTSLLGGVDTKALLLSLGVPLLELISGKVEKQALKKIAKNFLGGYVKWKAIELGFKGVKMILENRKKNKEDKIKTPA